MRKSQTKILLLKSGLVGGVNASIDFALFTLLTYAGIPYLASQYMSSICSGINSFHLNRRWTFQSTGHTNRGEILKFLVINLLSLLLTSGLLVIFHQYMGWPVTISKCFSMGIGWILNFCGNRLWVFEQSHQAYAGCLFNSDQPNDSSDKLDGYL
ncbi:GtrA family protein [Paenibacillus sp. LMG 31456]|uniref:GtrA family protein n=1 Tax=Paenibacillus foliorum TaxID=2654974 RepID=A0A972K3T3_9BACL|nr:GtrA family protein [Paenibacillus foliorum]NOU98151.1 GtrA family protein [Paenibacillus foliorum]